MAALRCSRRLAQVLLRTEVEFLFALGAAEVIGLPFMLGSSSGGSRAAALARPSLKSLPAFPHNQRYQAQRSNRIGPSDSPEGIRNQTCEGDDGQVAAERGLRCIGSQRRTGGQRGQLALLPCEHGHRNRCHDQYDDPEITWPHFTMSEQRQRGDERYVGCQPEQKASRDSGC